MQENTVFNDEQVAIFNNLSFTIINRTWLKRNMKTNDHT